MCFIEADGLAACYGSASITDKLTPPTNVSFHAVTAGDDFSCGLTDGDSSLQCWGALPGGTLQLPLPSTFFIDVHAGPRHVCGLVPNGTVYCYGDASSRGAIDVPPGVDFQGVSAGANYTCGVARNHSVVCWGDSDNPVVAAAATWQSITDVEHVAAGAEHACYVRVNGSVVCWGSNASGAADPPATLAVNGSVWWLAVGAGMTCALSGPSVPGPVTCWGAVNGPIASAGFEVACAGWGCVVSTASSSARVVVAAAAGGLPLPPIVGSGDRAEVVTLAGIGADVAGYADGVGGAARLFRPSGVSLDGAGGLYVAEYANHIIRRVDLGTRNVTTVAGIAGSTGGEMGATPLLSRFNYPRCAEVDDAGNVYVADNGNQAIRMLSGAWVAGSKTGVPGSTNAAAGTSATFYYPYAVRADVAGGLLYVADYNNKQVRTVAIAGNHAVATLATLPSYVFDIALDPAARVMYVAVYSSVYVVTYAGVSTLLAGAATSGYVDDTGSAARFNRVAGLALDAGADVLYATDYSNHRIRRVATTGGVVTTIAGSGVSACVDGAGTAAAFYRPWCIALDAVAGALYVSDSGGNAIRLVQLPLPAPVTLVPAPLPPSPLTSTHQLAAWRALGTANSSSNDVGPVLDARNATISSPLTPVNTAGLNPAIRTLLLGTVTLVPQNAALADAGNTNATFSTSAQRGLQSLSLATMAVPAAALALHALNNLTLAAPSPTQQIQLAAGSFDGLATLTCANCAGAVGLANLTGFLFGNLLTQPLILPLITSLDASATGITAVYEHDFDGMPALGRLSLADNNLSYVSDAAISASKQPALATVDQSRTPLVTGTGCPPTTYLRTYNLAASGNPYSACPPCIAGAYCAGGSGAPTPCGANTYSTGSAAACAPCSAGKYALGAAASCMTCPPGLAAPAYNATVTWRDTITVVADGAGSWINARIYLALSTKANVSCGPVVVVAPTSVSCALPFLLPAAGTMSVLTSVWVAHADTGGVPQRLNTNVTLMPSSLVTIAPGGSDGLFPLTPGSGRIVLRLPASRLTPADWTAAGLQPPGQATIDHLAVWVAGAPCSEPAWESSTTLSCAIPAADGNDIPVVVLLAGLFNVSGVLPVVFAPPALAFAAVDMALLPPANSGTSLVNITLPGTALCVGQQPRLTVAHVGGLRCGALQCVAGRPDAVQCVGWNATAAAAAGQLQLGSPTVLFNATAVWANRAAPLVTCEACISLATRPVLASITPTSIAAAGVPVVITGSGMMDATRTPPAVLIGGITCGNVAVLSQTVVQCSAPSMLASAPGYPVVSVVVINAAGAASIEPVNLTYPASFAVSWASTPTLTALPGGALAPSPALRVLSREAATCSLAINITSCATTNLALASRPDGMTVFSSMSLAVSASGTPDAVYTDLLLDALEASGASGCTGTLTASCVDTVGLTASTAGQSNPAVVLASWRADWNTSGIPAAPFVVAPEALPGLPAVFSLVSSNGVLTTSSVASLSCQALLLPASTTPPPLSQSLDRVSSSDVLSSVSGTVALINGSAAGIAFAGMTASAARVGQALVVYAECTWTPTGERVRLPLLPLAVANVTLALAPADSLLVEAYESAAIAAVASLSPAGAATFAGADAACTWRAGVSTSASLMLAASSMASSWTLEASGAVVGGQQLTVTVEGPPGATLALQLVCVLWGSNSVASSPLNITTRGYAVALQAGPVTRVVWPSGAQTVLSWAPALDVTAPARSVLTCTLSTVSSARGAGLGMSDTTVQVVGDASVSVVLDAAATRGSMSLSRVGLRAPGGSNATLAVACRDGVGRTATAGNLLNVSVAALTADWSSATAAAMPTVVVPGQTLPVLALTVASSPGVALPAGVDVGSLVTCVAGLFAASTPLLLATALASAVASAGPFASVSTGGSGASVGVGAGNTSIVIAMPALSTATCPLSVPLVVAAECTWVPTGERLRLPPLSLEVVNVSLALTPSTAQLVEAYEVTTVAAAATLSPPGVSTFAGADARCTWRTIAATSSSVVLAAASSAASWTLDTDGAVVGSQPLTLTVEGPPGATLTLQLVCSLWGGNTVVSPPLNVTTRTYIVALRDSVSDAPVVRTMWPSGTSLVLPWAPALDVTAPARNVLTCSVSVASTTLPPTTTPAAVPGVGLGLSDATAQLVGEASVSMSPDAAATRANVSLPRVGLRAPGGTNASLVLTCRDGVGRSTVLDAPINVVVATLSAAWSAATVASMPAVVVPSQALPSLTLTLASMPAVPLPPDTDVTSLLSCVAGIFLALTPLPLTTPLATLIASASPFASFSTASINSGATITTGANNASIVVTLPPLPTATCPLATQLTVAAECTWVPTGERVRLPPLTTSTLQLTLAWAAPAAIVLAYTPLPLGVTKTVGAPATSSSGATTTASCDVALVNATVRSTRLVAEPWSLAVDGSASGGTSIPTSVNVTLQAPPATQVYLQTLCTVWGQVLATPPLRLTTASLGARILSALPSTFIASDVSSPWPLTPQLVVAVITRHNDAVVADVTCSVSVATPATELVIVDGTTALTSLRSIPTDDHTGIVAVPRFVVQTSPATRNVTLVVECQHLASGDAVAPLSLTIPATLLTAQLCVPPAGKAPVGDPLPAFSIGVAAALPNGTRTSPCTGDTLTVPLPSIVCTIALNASASSSNDTSSVFLQHTVVVASADSHVAVFDAFTLVAPQGEAYGLTLTCAIGGLVIPPALAFLVEVDGCRAGQESVSITCVTCGSGEFSLGGMGARCIRCPPAGASCIDGIVTLLPHYFRPAAQAGAPLGPDTELHPCYNAEACMLEYNANANSTTGNSSAAVYGCAYGYTGPLCGVCDAAVNFARFGEA